MKIPSDNERTNEQTNKRANERTNEQTNKRTNEQTNERTNERLNGVTQNASLDKNEFLKKEEKEEQSVEKNKTHRRTKCLKELNV